MRHLAKGGNVSIIQPMTGVDLQAQLMGLRGRRDQALSSPARSRLR